MFPQYNGCDWSRESRARTSVSASQCVSVSGSRDSRCSRHTYRCQGPVSQGAADEEPNSTARLYPKERVTRNRVGSGGAGPLGSRGPSRVGRHDGPEEISRQNTLPHPTALQSADPRFQTPSKRPVGAGPLARRGPRQDGARADPAPGTRRLAPRPPRACGAPAPLRDLRVTPIRDSEIAAAAAVRRPSLTVHHGGRGSEPPGRDSSGTSGVTGAP